MGYDELTNWYMALTPEELPKPPFELKLAHEVTGPLFFVRLREEIERGPESPRAMTGALEDDLLALKRVMWCLNN